MLGLFKGRKLWVLIQDLSLKYLVIFIFNFW
jgi:hypothetical protein